MITIFVGSTWDTKVRRCGAMIHKYIKKASRPFQSLHNRATFFNTEIPQSTVHSLACHFGYVCVENIQIYSLLSNNFHNITVNLVFIQRKYKIVLQKFGNIPKI